MPQAHVWTSRALQPPALAVLEGLASVFVSKVGERNDWYAEASTADAIFVAGETFVTDKVVKDLPLQLGGLRNGQRNVSS